MSILSVENISKSYGEKILFDQISFTISEQQRIGLIGVNGTGKSTLLKIIAGLDSPDSGKITHANGFRIDYLPQNPLFENTSSVLEQVFYGETPLMQTLREYEQLLALVNTEPENSELLTRLIAVQQRMDAVGAWDASTEAKTVLSKLGINDFGQMVGELSGGQRKRVALARLLIQPADLIILDEPTNHLDNDTVIWLEEYLARFRGAFVLVTHDRYFLERVTNRIVELDGGKLYSYEGNYSTFLEKKAEREEREVAEEGKRQNLLRRELAWLHRGAKARTTKQKARVERAEELRDRKVKGPEAQMDIALGASRLGKTVVELDHVVKAFEDRMLIKDFSYIVMPDDRIGIIGPNGSGKSTLLNMIAGRIAPTAGEIAIGQTVKLAYYTQESIEMDGSLRVIEYVKEVAEVIRTADGSQITAAQMLERFLFPPHMQWTKIERLSGGEKRRLYLLRTLMGEPNVLLLDEPTNDLDIQTLTILEDYLEVFPGAVITVSHDRYFLDKVTDHLFTFEGEGTVRSFFGNYSEYMEQRKMELAEREQSLKANARKSAATVSETGTDSNVQRQRKLSYKEQREWETIEERIAELEEKVAAIKREIAGIGSDYMKAQELTAHEETVSAELERTMERWEELSLLVEEIENSRS